MPDHRDSGKGKTGSRRRWPRYGWWWWHGLLIRPFGSSQTNQIKNGAGFAPAPFAFLRASMTRLDRRVTIEDIQYAWCRGRTGFDLIDASVAACRGWFVGLVNHR